MYRPVRIVFTTIAAALFSLHISACLADANSKSRFDLPAEPLDKALRDFAIQAHCNVSYVPSLVAGLRAPAIKGEFLPATVLSMMLAGTRLTAVNVDENTIQVLEDSESTNVSAGKNGAKDESELNEIVVTGTHIRGVPSASPVIEIGQEEIKRSGYTSVSDLMLSLPQNFGGGYNPGSAIPNSAVNNSYLNNPTGASVPNLRGLGPGSTLTLIDGHRMASPLTGGGADISSIPLDAIDRIEVVTDSASSIYGSDAVAGVVNIILKRNNDGANTSLAYGLATQGGGTEKRGSQLFGTSWESGTVVATYEYRQQDLVDARDRAFSSSTPGPFSLLPQTNSNSMTLSATQDISPTMSAFVDGLFVARDANSFDTNLQLGAPYDSPSTLRKYAVTTGIDSSLWRDWKLSFFLDAAEDATQSTTGLLGPSLIPPSNQRLLGKLGNVEANANGRIATLPSGAVRLAVGAGYRQESFSDVFGTTDGSLNVRTNGYRNIRYAFGEVSIPLVEHTQRAGLNSIDLVASARSERYSDFGEKTVPKAGLVYAPSESMKLRTTWGQAFRAPNLYDIASVQQLVILSEADPTSPSGSAPVFVRSGGNPALRPETADSWSMGLDYSAPGADGLRLSATLFDIKYTNRISQIANPYAALTDPLNGSFVTRAPSPGVLQSVYDAYPPSEIFNYTGGPFNIDSIAAIVDYRMVNVSRETASGADLTINYKIGSDSSGATFFVNGAYLDLTQQNTPQSPSEELSGLAFYPAKLRTRSGATWQLSSWALTGTVNYLGREMNTQVIPLQSVGSWTTIDTSLRYAPLLPGVFSGLRFSLAAINLFDRDPPRVLIPPTVGGIYLDYDSSNTNPMGRFISLSISKKW